jgi:hypothetical protein
MIAPPVPGLKRRFVCGGEEANSACISSPAPSGAWRFRQQQILPDRAVDSRFSPAKKNRQPTMLSAHQVDCHFGRKFAIP